MPEQGKQEVTQSEKVILDAIKSLENKIVALQSREERDRQYKLMGYSVILASILSTLIYITFTVVENITQIDLTPVFLILVYFLVFLFIHYQGKMKETYQVGDFVIKGTLMPLEGDNKRKIIESIYEIAKINSKCFISNVQMSGFTRFNYLWKTFGENHVKKMVFV